ncbi:MAG: hypothetical protein ACI8P0_001618 [Planctomycetaceae bacterium]|jgi:hypothetical protein
MKTIALDAPNVRMATRVSDSGPSLELPLDLFPEINQRDIEDLQTLAKWFKETSIELAEIDDVFSDFDILKSALD